MGTVRIRTDHPDPSGIRHRHGCLSQAQVCEIYKCAISMNAITSQVTKILVPPFRGLCKPMSFVELKNAKKLERIPV